MGGAMWGGAWTCGGGRRVGEPWAGLCGGRGSGERGVGRGGGTVGGLSAGESGGKEKHFSSLQSVNCLESFKVGETIKKKIRNNRK